MSMFSPPRREKARPDDSHLPKGDCRYILLHPEVKGQRCACVGFALNRSIPGSSCDCGHQACYHFAEKETNSVERQELDALKEKVNLLAEELHRERHGTVERLGRLEEMVDKASAENDAGFKNLHRGIGGLWHHVALLNKRMPYYDDHIEGLVDDVQSIQTEVQRIQNRVEEVDDATMTVEDRVEALEKTSAATAASTISRRRKASTPPSLAFDDAMGDCSIKTEDTVTANYTDSRLSLHPVTEESSHIQSFRERVASVGSGFKSWTVHISLLPTSSQPFPFEKDTAAYKRCLSRGLHRVIVIPDTDSHSFKTSVSDAFAEILRGRPWRPLVARICDAKNLRGLPMLRQLPDRLVGNDCDVEFLQKNCAVVDEVGKILDLYIAMLDDTISWAELREVSPFLPGLEASWTYDPFLDGPYETDGSGALGPDGGALEKRPAAGDILPSWPPSLKRNASEISRTPSFGSSTDGESSRTKMQRQCTNAPVEVVGRRAEAV